MVTLLEVQQSLDQLFGINLIKGNQHMSEAITKGVKTSEFWLVVLSAILMVANKGLGLNIDEATTLSFAGMVVTYIAGRSAVKAVTKS